MKLHANAKTCPNSRLLICQRVLEEGWSLMAAAEAAGVSERTAAKWVARFRKEGRSGLADRSSAPKQIPHKTPDRTVKAIEALRRVRMTAAEIAETLELALSTVSAVLKRIGLGKRSRLEPPEPPNRYERRRPGELIHIDIKKLGRFDRPGKRIRTRGPGLHRHGTGWEFCHVCIDDHSRLAYVEILDDEKAPNVSGFLRRACAWFGERGVAVQRVMTDNGPGYRSNLHATACQELGIKHLRTRPYRPRTNGKAERFIQTMLREWAYGRLYGSSQERAAALPAWLDRYNFRRPHGSLGHRPPGSRLNNLAGNYI
jgi:transposase InsO family protein